MVTVHLKGRVTADHVLEVQVPHSLQPGEVDVTITVQSDTMTSREDVRAKLRAAGLLVEEKFYPDDLPPPEPFDEDELFDIGPGLTTAHLIDDDRGER